MRTGEGSEMGGMGDCSKPVKKCTVESLSKTCRTCARLDRRSKGRGVMSRVGEMCNGARTRSSVYTWRSRPRAGPESCREGQRGVR